MQKNTLSSEIISELEEKVMFRNAVIAVLVTVLAIIAKKEVRHK